MKTRERRARSRPIVLDDRYLRAIARLESLPQNRSGADKSWVEHALRSWRNVCHTAARVR